MQNTMQNRIQDVMKCLNDVNANQNAIFAIVGLVADNIIKYCPVCGYPLDYDIEEDDNMN